MDYDPFQPLPWDRKRLDWCDLIMSPYCDLTPSQKLSLVVMSSYGDAWGVNIYPSQKEIAFRSGVSSRTVWQAVNRAEKEGWLLRYKTKRGNGFPYTTYSLAIPLGVHYATEVILKSKFWLPPYHYGMVREGKMPRLIKRATGNICD